MEVERFEARSGQGGRPSYFRKYVYETVFAKEK